MPQVPNDQMHALGRLQSRSPKVASQLANRIGPRTGRVQHRSAANQNLVAADPIARPYADDNAGFFFEADCGDIIGEHGAAVRRGLQNREA